MKAFVSYSMADRVSAAETKKALDRLGIDSFMAHEDLVVSEEWKKRILEELKSSQLFVCLLSKNFKTSDWCPQELGFAVARPKAVIIPLSLDQTVAFGFINHLQSQIVKDTWQIEDAIVHALLRKKPQEGIAASIRRMMEVKDYRFAENLTRRQVPFFPKFTREQANQFAEAAIKNAVVWDAGECATKILPKFLEICESKLIEKNAKALRFQITERTRYKS